MRSNTDATEDDAWRSFAAAGARCIRRAVHYAASVAKAPTVDEYIAARELTVGG